MQATLDFEQARKAPVKTRQMIATVKAAEEDFEWYPTTDAIIAALIKDIGRKDYPKGSVLDIGAGNGKVLRALRDAKLGYHRDQGFSKLYAIEKSQALCQQLDADIFIVGTEFMEQSLLSKQVDVIFCNPPFSAYEDWAEKIIREAASQVVYLVVPERWDGSVKIADALRYREAVAKSVGSFDFEHAERAARARVSLLRVGLEVDRYGHTGEPNNAFKRHFKEQFAGLFEKFGEGKKTDDEEEEVLRRAYTEKRKAKFAQLVIGPTYPEAMVSIYNAELAHIQNNYQLVAELDADLMREFDISPIRIMKCLDARLKGLRSDYWHELFAHLSAITDRLTAKSRKELLETLHANVHVDFTHSNIYAVIIWVIKNANRYIDSQLIETYEVMVNKANVVLYKSNQKTFRDDQWRYVNSNRDDLGDQPERYALDYRIVTHRVGGVNSGTYSFERGLEERGAEFIGDLLTIAKNLGGFNTSTVDGRISWDGRKNWTPGALEEFYFNGRNGKREMIFDVRGFKNGNIHFRLNQRFILALNVEHGRLKGWLRTPAEAAEELKDPQAAACFQSNKQLMRGDVPLLMA